MLVIGTFMAWYFYVQNPDIPNLIAQKFSAFYKFLFNKWYFDELYDFLFVQPAFRAGRALWKKGDGAVIDGFGPDGISETVRRLSGQAVRLQSGFLYHYAFAMMIGLTIYTSVQVAEIVRGSIQSLPRGQVEAAISLGLSPFQRLRLVILPQALRSMIPPMNNQYLNCWKNSSLALIISFSDQFAVTMTIVNNAGQAVPAFIMLLVTYQIGSMLISAIMNYLNSRVTSVKI